MFFSPVGVQPYRQARACSPAGLDREAWIQGQIDISSHISLFFSFSPLLPLCCLCYLYDFQSQLLKSVPSSFHFPNVCTVRFPFIPSGFFILSLRHLFHFATQDHLNCVVQKEYFFTGLWLTTLSEQPTECYIGPRTFGS